MMIHRWKTITKGECWNTTDRVSSEYKGIVYFDKYTNTYDYRIVSLEDKSKSWRNAKKPFKTLGRAKSQCWRAVINMPCNKL